MIFWLNKFAFITLRSLVLYYSWFRTENVKQMCGLNITAVTRVLLFQFLSFKKVITPETSVLKTKRVSMLPN